MIINLENFRHLLNMSVNGELEQYRRPFFDLSKTSIVAINIQSLNANLGLRKLALTNYLISKKPDFCS